MTAAMPPLPEPTLADLVTHLWRARAAVVVGGLAGCALAALFLFFAIPHYRVTMLVVPVERGMRADVKNFLPDNPGVALEYALQYMTGSVSALESTEFSRFEHILRGRSVAAALLDDPAIADGLRAMRRFVFMSGPRIGTADDMAAVLDRHVHVMPVGNTSLRRIAFDHPDPGFAINMLHRLYVRGDSLIRADAAGRSALRVEYLHGMLEKTTHPDHRRALAALLMEQEHVLMMLRMDEPFSAMIAEPPAASARPWWPRRSLVFTGFAFAGALAGFAIFGMRPR